ncbi:hypothetical protein [Nocardia pseudovaccinii]|uniref:hypothetical protein n=1 Tax=Nocardia pseudovaccinii TaxID=189540 RepID=UPI0007A4632E|nr:hypothetical protein [Nocardia pseudovaccinii]
MSDDTTGIRAAEAVVPGFVFNNGWTHFECGECREAVYDGPWIGPEDAEELRRIHRVACDAETRRP